MLWRLWRLTSEQEERHIAAFGQDAAFATILSARHKALLPAFSYFVARDAHTSRTNSRHHKDRIIAALDLEHPIERVPYTALRDSLCPSMLVDHP